jgi:hypothetical protein
LGDGYAPLAWRLEGGLDMESTRLVLLVRAAYDIVHLASDGIQPGLKGHDRYLESGAYFRPTWQPLPGQVFIGFGWRWNQFSTTDSSKTANRPQIGGGYDFAMRPCSGCRRNFSVRIAMDWVMAGKDWQNGKHGPAITFSLPTPREKRHWFFQERVDVYRFHETVTDATNISLARSQRADRSVSCDAEFAILYRF